MLSLHNIIERYIAGGMDEDTACDEAMDDLKNLTLDYLVQYYQSNGESVTISIVNDIKDGIQLKDRLGKQVTELVQLGRIDTAERYIINQL